MRLSVLFLTLLVLSSCAGEKRRNDWGDIDYSKVRDRAARDNDGSYKAPSVVSCVSDDLYECR